MRGALAPILCPLGYKQYADSLNTTFENTCEPCRPGYFGNDPNRQSCQPCRPGVVCKGKATTDVPMNNNTAFGFNVTNSYPCPEGFYCPRNSSFPIPCPPGTFRAQPGGGSLEECIPCPIDHFNHLVGKTSCLDCGSEASQPQPGQASCVCLGQGQMFLPSDRSCKCAPGLVLNNANSRDCSQRVFSNCAEGMVRFQDGECLFQDQLIAKCRDEICGEEEFRDIDFQTATCLCQTEDLDSICDKACRNKQKDQIKIPCKEPIDGDTNTNDKIEVNNNGEKLIIDASSLNIINGEESLIATTCQGSGRDESTSMYFLDVTTSGFVGTYGEQADQIIDLLGKNKKNNETTESTNSRRRRRRSAEEENTFSVVLHERHTRSLNGLENETSTFSTATTAVPPPPPPQPTFTGINNPFICIDYGTVLMFYVSENEFPQYERDNLLNRNLTKRVFDDGGFRRLIELKLQVSLASNNGSKPPWLKTAPTTIYFGKFLLLLCRFLVKETQQAINHEFRIHGTYIQNDTAATNHPRKIAMF